MKNLPHPILLDFFHHPIPQSLRISNTLRNAVNVGSIIHLNYAHGVRRCSTRPPTFQPWTEMTQSHKLMKTFGIRHSEIKSAIRASRQKPRKVLTKCLTCKGTGEFHPTGRGATRCPTCLGSRLARQPGNRQIEMFLV